MTRGSVSLAVGLAFLGLGAVARAQAPEIEMTADRTTVGLSDRFQLQVRVATRGGVAAEHIQLPALDAFVVEGRSVSRPMQFSFGFGQGPVVQQTTVYTFDLRPRQVGSFTLPAVEARVGGITYRGQPLTITVTQGGGGLQPAPLVPGRPFDPWGRNPLTPLIPIQPLDQQPQHPGPTGGPPPEGLSGAQYDDELFVRAVLDKERAFIGEQVTLTVYLYTRVGIRDLDVPQEPGTEGFWVEDLLGPVRRLDFQDQYVGSTRFEVAVVRKMALFPIRAGELTISPMEVLATSSVGGFFGSGQLRRSGVPVSVDVLPLPAEGQPPRFEASNVGRYELDARVDRNQVNAGEAVTLTVTVSGEGNLRNLRLPALASSRMVRVYDPQVRDTIAPHGDTIAGQRVYEYLMMPGEAGRIELPRPALSFFDPTRRTYRTRTAPAITILVTGTPAVAAESPTRADSEAQLRPIRLQSELGRRSSRLYETPWFAAAVAVPPLALLGLVAGTALRDRRRGARERARPRRAHATALRVLRDAASRRRAGDATAFFAGVSRTLTTYLEERLSRPIGGMTMEALRQHLESRGYPENLVEELIRELENCDFARFTPEGTRAREMSECLDRARRLLATLDRVTPSAEPGP
ncbi:MAG: protein BatD [Deltaproteobacteria bacterium]|nr:protein BatD [Deltaproteobacteria bacterium]